MENSDLPPGIGICADRFFMDHALVDWCFSRDYTVIGTVTNDKRCVPPSMRPNYLQGNPERYSRHCSLTAFIPERHAVRNFKSVLCLSSEHLDSRIDLKSGKPLSILAYNELKLGVDMANWCLKEYSTKKTT